MRRLLAFLIATLALVAVAATSAAQPNPPGHSAPLNLGAPGLAGAAVIAQQLNASTGSWSGPPAAYTFQWQHCDSSGGSCSAIGGATGQSYTVASTDAGSTLRITVTATNKNGSSIASSAASAPVPNAPVAAPSGGGTTTTVPAPQTTTTTTAAATTTTTRPTTTTATTTATTTPTTTTTPAPPPSGSLLFDGRAAGMTQLYSTGVNTQAESPSVWACLCFVMNDISLTADSRFGKVYSVTTGPGSQNPSWTPQPGVAQSEVSVRRPVRLGQWDWYANSFEIQPGYTNPDWAVLDQMNYPTLTSPPLAIAFDKAGVGIDQHVGYVPSVGGTAQINNFPRFFSVASVTGKWVDFLIGVKWATDTTGEIDVYTRCRECGDSDWVLRYSKTNTITMQWGGGIMNQDGTAPGTNTQITTLDKEGLYFGFNSVPSPLPTNHVLESGLVRATTQAAAEAALP